MSKWINNKVLIWTEKEVTKPCHVLGFCPYGQLVEEFPIKKKRNNLSCKTFGHDCPVFYHAETIIEW